MTRPIRCAGCSSSATRTRPWSATWKARPRNWGIYGAPETFLVDAGGIVRWKHVGPLDQAIVETELLPALAAAERAR